MSAGAGFARCEFILGGQKSGKSRRAESLAADWLAADASHRALLIATAQAVEHYEIARYGTMCRWAELIGQKQASKLLKETLAEEEATDSNLTKIAEGSVNQAALKAA